MLPFIPQANQPWFTFSIACSSEPVPFAVYAFSGTERVNEPFEFHIEFVARDSGLPTAAFLGREGLLSIADKSGKARLVHGLISQMRQLHTGSAFTHYQCVLVPRLWFLNETVNHRIYQNKNVMQIIDDVLKTQMFVFDSYDFRLKGTYPEREYCTQYGESDLHFISRLCEEEGIIFHFSHTREKHCLIFTDTAGGPPIPGEADIRFFPGSGNVADAPVIARLTHQQRINSDSASYREWNFLTPEANLEVNKNEPDWLKAPAPPALKLESYRFPHLYQEEKEGERYADIQLARQLVLREWVEGSGDVSRMTPGHVFNLHEHPRADLNRQWWIREVTHKGEQPGVLEQEAPTERGLRYHASFAAIPAETRFVPELAHEKKRIGGVQSALVVGPDYEEIYVDEQGRVKVQFHWDRRGGEGTAASCWIRVSQGWAGGNYGALAIPRIGHEVLVSFMEGDPDRPIITGRAYHAMNTAPYELPAHRTRTVLKSYSSPGGGGFNELRIEDRKDEEEIYVHAQKDMNIHVGNDWKEHVLHDHHATVDNDLFAEVKGETHERYHGPRKTELSSDDNLTIHANRHEQIEGKWLTRVDDEIHIRAGAKIVLEAGTEITLKTGDSFIRLDPSGMRSLGREIGLNSGGSPGVGSGAAPELPAHSQTPEAGSVPAVKKLSQAWTLLAAHKAAQPLCPICGAKK